LRAGPCGLPTLGPHRTLRSRRIPDQAIKFRLALVFGSANNVPARRWREVGGALPAEACDSMHSSACRTNP